MNPTAETIVAAIAFLLPGALYEWAFERVVGSWNIGTGDRVLRFLGSSAVLHALALPATVALWRRYLVGGWSQIEGVPWGLWVALLAAVVVPTLLGMAVGKAFRSGRRWVTPIVGVAPAPRAWDHLFLRAGAGWIRIKLVTGEFVAGQYATEPGPPCRQAYASGFPNPTDLYLINRVEVDPTSGEFRTDHAGNLVPIGSGILVRQDQIAILEFFERSRGG